MKMFKCVSVAVAAILAATALAPLAAFADETPIEFQPYGPIIHNSADDLNDFSKVADAYAGGFAYAVESLGTDNAGLYTNSNWHYDARKFWGDGVNTATDIPDPYLTWQVTKGSTVDLVVYEHSSVQPPYLTFFVSEDNKTWTEVTAKDDSNAAGYERIVLDAEKKTELELTDISDVDGFTLYDYRFTVPGDNIFVKVVTELKEGTYNYSFNITKFRAMGGESLPAKLTFDSEFKLSDTVANTLATFDSHIDASAFSEFDDVLFNGDIPQLTLSYDFLIGKESLEEKAYVVFKVADNSPFVLQAAMNALALNMGPDFDFKFYTSADKSQWSEAVAIGTLNALETAAAAKNNFNAYKYYTITVPEGHNYVKVEYPQDKDYSEKSIGDFLTHKSNANTPLSHIAGIVGAKYDKYVAPVEDNDDNNNQGGNQGDNDNQGGNDNNNSSTPAEPEKVKVDTTITFTGADADFSKMAGYNKNAIDLSQKIAGKNTVMVKYDYLIGQTKVDPMYITYKVAEKSPFIAKVYLHTNAAALGWAPKFYVSADNKTWTAVEAKATTVSSEVEGFPGWIDMLYTIDEIPAGNAYVKVEYPQTKDMTGTEVPGGGTVGDPLNYGVAIYELQFAKPKSGSASTGVADFAVFASVAMVLSVAAVAYVVLSKKQNNR